MAVAVFLLTILYWICLSAGDIPFCSRMCNSSADSRQNVLFSSKCSCSKSCVVYDDCCYDSPHKHGARPSDLGFGCLSVSGLGDFRAVTSCPPSWSTSSCSELLGYLPPVTSRVTNVTYGNVFCASCNDDGDNLARWNVHLRCPRRNDPHDVGLDFSQLRYRRGSLWGRGGHWTPCKFYAHYDDFGILRDLELRRCVVPTTVATCSETWEDHSVQEKCRSYKDLVYVGNVPFRNAHCAECHRVNSSECLPAYVRDLLEEGAVEEAYLWSCVATSDSVHRCVAELGKGKVYSISMMFGGNDFRECLPPAGRLCCSGERYDDNTGRCRTVRRG